MLCLRKAEAIPPYLERGVAGLAGVVKLCAEFRFPERDRHQIRECFTFPSRRAGIVDFDDAFEMRRANHKLLSGQPGKDFPIIAPTVDDKAPLLLR